MLLGDAPADTSMVLRVALRTQSRSCGPPRFQARAILLPKICTVRHEAVMLDSELALLYGVQTGQFNRAMKRNAARFPADFAFRLTLEEWAALRCQIGTLKTGGRGQHRKYLPQVFTEHGAIMAATVLNGARAVSMSVYLVRAFVKIRPLLLPTPEPSRRRIGFHTREDEP